MEKHIRYLDYTVQRNGKLIHSGKVPDIIAVGGSHKDYDLEGIWLTHSDPNLTVLNFSYNSQPLLSSYSDSTKDEWLDFLENSKSNNIPIDR